MAQAIMRPSALDSQLDLCVPKKHFPLENTVRDGKPPLGQGEPSGAVVAHGDKPTPSGLGLPALQFDLVEVKVEVVHAESPHL